MQPVRRQAEIAIARPLAPRRWGGALLALLALLTLLSLLTLLTLLVRCGPSWSLLLDTVPCCRLICIWSQACMLWLQA